MGTYNAFELLSPDSYPPWQVRSPKSHDPSSVHLTVLSPFELLPCWWYPALHWNSKEQSKKVHCKELGTVPLIWGGAPQSVSVNGNLAPWLLWYCKFGNFRVTFILRIFYFCIISQILKSWVSICTVYKALSNSLLARTLNLQGSQFTNFIENLVLTNISKFTVLILMWAWKVIIPVISVIFTLISRINSWHCWFKYQYDIANALHMSIGSLNSCSPDLSMKTIPQLWILVR